MSKEYICLGVSLLLFLALPLNCAQSSYADTQAQLENVIIEEAPTQEQIQAPPQEPEQESEEQPPPQKRGYNDSLDNMQEELEELKKDLKELKKRRRDRASQ
jgi:Skp family chaperone for outer membrane proteins